MTRRTWGKVGVTVVLLAIGAVGGLLLAGVTMGLLGLLPGITITEPLGRFGLGLGAVVGAVFIASDVGLIRMWRRA